MKPLLLPALCAVLLLGCRAKATNDPKPTTTQSTPPAPAPGAAAAPAAPSPTPAPSIGSIKSIKSTESIQPTTPPPADLPVPAQDVLRLSQTAVGEPVVLAYIEGLKTPFTLNADQIIYLSDLGLTTPVISALVKKAGGTGNEVATAAPAPQPSPEPAPAPATAAPPAGAPPAPSPSPAAAAAPGSLPVPGAPQPSSGAPVYGPAQAAPAAAAPPAPAGTAPVVVAAPPQAVSYTTFYDSLAPYGNWVLVEPYGWCWQPAVVAVTPTWRPYCDGGQWMWTDYGWYWQSTYTWGWAPFHYGRWHRSARIGWVWAPGSDWGPAWVSWRYSNAYCGWAPLPPECHWSAGVGFSWVSGGLGVSVGFGLFNDCWYACSWNRFRDPALHRHALDRPRVNQFVNDSKIAVGGDRSINIAGNNNTVIVNNGLPVDQVQRHSRDEVRKVAVSDAASPEAAQRAMRGAATARPEVAVYRPRINAEGDRAPAPPPSVLSRQESRKAPGVTTASNPLPTRTGTARPSMLVNAESPVPGILGASAPAPSSRPVPSSRPAVATGSASPGSSVPVTTLPARTMERPRPNPGIAPSTPSAPTAPAPNNSPARPAPTRPLTSYPGANVGVPTRPEVAPAPAPSRSPGVANPAPARPAPGPMPSPNAPAPTPSRPVLEGPRTLPSRYPGANVGNNPAPSIPAAAPAPATLPNIPATPSVPPSRGFTPAPRPDPVAPSLPPQRSAPPTFTPRPEPRSFAPAPAPAPSPMAPPSAAPRTFAPAPTAPPPRTFAPAPSGPSPAPAPSYRPEAPRPAPGRGGPSER